MRRQKLEATPRPGAGRSPLFAHVAWPENINVLLPTTRFGRIAAIGMTVFVLLMGLFAILVAAGQRGGDEFFDNLWLTVPVLVAFASAVVATVAGVVAVVGQRERSVAAIAATIVGLAVTIFGFMEVAFPH